MSTAQLSRIERMNSQPLYLIDKQFVSEHNCNFIISGSTANIYNVSVNFNENNVNLETPIINCNCPDMDSWAKTDNVKCKHCCFVWIKVLRLPPTWLTTIEFNQPQYKILQKSLSDLVVRSELINTAYQQKYRQLASNPAVISHPMTTSITTTTTTTTVETTVSKFAITKDLIDSECPICFDSLDPSSSSECPTCHNAVHNICITKWLSNGNKSCVYCRGDWSEFNKPAKPATAKKTKKNTNNTNVKYNYLNLDS